MIKSNDVRTRAGTVFDSCPYIDDVIDYLKLNNAPSCVPLYFLNIRLYSGIRSEPATMSIWQKDEDKELGLINLGMSKNRFGPNFGSIALKIDYSTLTITEDETINESDEAKDFTKTLTSLGGLT